MEGVVDIFLTEKYSIYRNIAAAFGMAFFGRIVLRTLRELCSGFRAYFLAPMGWRINLKYGKWAVVTGASDGIGKEYAIELARRGLNIVLMSRSKDKLDRVAEEIKEKHGRETMVIPVDFSGGMEIYSMIKDVINTLDIGILVNNVGMYYYYPDLVGNLPAENQYKMVQVNCQPVVQMTHVILPGMVSRGKGIVVNVSSVGGLMPATEGVVYSATKVFVDYFSEGLRKEYHGKGIIVQNVAPAMVSTNLMRNAPTIPAIMTAPAFAKAAVATIGIQDYTHGCFSHAVQFFIVRRLPTFVWESSSHWFSAEFRQRVLNQDNKEKKE